MSFNNSKKNHSSKRLKIYKDEDEALKASYRDLERKRVEKYILGDSIFSKLNSHPDVRTDITDIIKDNLKEIENLKEALHNSRTKQVEYRTDLEVKKVELKAMQACVRQYEAKVKKVRELSMAGIERQSEILFSANDFMERGERSDEYKISSDTEDKKENNKVLYSYVDHDVFND